MRVYGHSRSRGPSWVLAIVIFLGLLVLLQLFRGAGSGAKPLTQQFAAKPPEPGAGQWELPPLPSSVGDLARTAASRIHSGSTGPALTPVAQNPDLRIEINGIRQAPGGLRVMGSATNSGQRPLSISLADFRFADGTGTVYTAENAATTALEPGQRAPLDLTLPIQDARQLTLDVQVKGVPPLHMVLIQAPR